MMAKSTTIELALGHMSTTSGKWMTTGAIASAIGRSLEGTRGALMKYHAQHPDDLERSEDTGTTLWSYTPLVESMESLTGTREHAIDVPDVDEGVKLDIVDEMDEVIEALDGVMDALMALKMIREKLPSLLHNAELGDSILQTLDRYINERTA
jgi:hypothetical protein